MTAGSNGTGKAPPAPPAVSTDPSLLGKSLPAAQDGFTRVPPTADVNIPGREPQPAPHVPPRYTPPPPPSSDEGRALPPLTVPATPGLRPAAAAPLPPPAPVPSCTVVGGRVDQLALYDVDGKPWELRRDRKGRLVLLDFWYTGCTPCLNAAGHLRELQRVYGPYGLHVVGVAYESGTAEQQMAKVRAARSRHGMNYTMLLGGGGAGPCPVKAQFRVTAFPTLVLIDEAGQIVWRGEGLDEMNLYQLKVEVHRRLGLPLR
jgi:thiol-disulfide isomerase/thioredoxin